MVKLRHGRGAECSVLTKFIHPLQLVRDKHVNLEKTHQTEVLLVDEIDIRVNRRMQKCYSLRSDDYPNKLLHAVRRHVTVKKEGGLAGIFGAVNPTHDNDDETEVATAEAVVVNKFMVEDASKILSGS